jgi:hypothetical protein
MSASGDALRRRASDAEQVASEAAELASYAAELTGLFGQVGAEMDRLVGGTATGADQRMRTLLGVAGDAQRRASEACRDAASHARDAVRRLESEAAEADRLEAQSRERSR